MNVTRRRFLSISAAFACVPGVAQSSTWQGRAFGGDISLTLRGPVSQAQDMLVRVRHLVHQIEAQFSLFDPTSAISRLNHSGVLRNPDAHFFALMQQADRAFQDTQGLFDPTVQPLWQAAAKNAPLDPALALIGWDRVSFSAHEIRLDPGQALTFNGIAQGYATDQVATMLRGAGFGNVLINIGEYRALGGPWILGLDDPGQGRIGQRTLHGMAIATSSPTAMSLPSGAAHILHPSADPQWSTVSVEAKTATRADSLSTAFALASRDRIKAMVANDPELGRITLVDQRGDLTTL